MPLDAQTQAVLEMLAAMGGPPLYTLSVADARQVMVAMAAMGGEAEPVGKTEDREIVPKK